MSTETPPQVAAAAQQPDAIDLSSLALIGLMSGAQGPTALLRDRSGTIARVAPGDQAFGMTVAALDAQAIHLVDRRGAAVVLTMPPG